MGGQKGELWVIGAYTGEGKSQALMNMSYYSSVYQKKNNVIISAEMPKDQYRRRIIVRHSMNAAFGLEDHLFSLVVGHAVSGGEFSLATASAVNVGVVEEVGTVFKS